MKAVIDHHEFIDRDSELKSIDGGIGGGLNMEKKLHVMDCEYCYAVPGSNSIYDSINPITGLTWYYGKTLDEVRQEKGYEEAVLMLIDDFCAAKGKRQNTPITWDETTEDNFTKMLEVLPPAAWHDGGFLVGEAWDHDALTGRPRYQAFKEIEGKFFAASRAMTEAEFNKEV